MVRTLKNGLNTTLGDRGIRVSGGERQKESVLQEQYLIILKS